MLARDGRRRAEKRSARARCSTKVVLKVDPKSSSRKSGRRPGAETDCVRDWGRV